MPPIYKERLLTKKALHTTVRIEKITTIYKLVKNGLHSPFTQLYKLLTKKLLIQTKDYPPLQNISKFLSNHIIYIKQRGIMAQNFATPHMLPKFHPSPVNYLQRTISHKMNPTLL